MSMNGLFIYLLISWFVLHTVASEGLRCIDWTNTAAIGKVAVVIAGSSRSLKYVLPSIEHHVFDVLTRHGFEYDVIWSSIQAENNGIWVVNDNTPKSELKSFDQWDARMVRPCLYSSVSQVPTLHEQFDRMCSTKNITCKNGRILHHTITKAAQAQLKNYLGCFYVQKKAASLIKYYSEGNHFTYDAVLFIRPDTAIVADIDLPKNMEIIRQDKNAIFIPNFQEYDGVNDRAAYGSYDVMMKYLQRSDDFFEDTSDKLRIAEFFLEEIVRKYKMNVHATNLRCLRVRTTQFDEGIMRGVVYHLDTQRKSMNMDDNQWNEMEKCFIPKSDSPFTPGTKLDHLRVMEPDKC